MKKRNIFAILAALAVMLVVFAACGEKEPEQPENPTVIGADGQVYEEVTEIATEIVTEIVSEVVTDKQGEAVTDKEGKTEVVTEVKTEVLTTVVTVTKPYEPSTAETTNGKQENTNASEPSSEGSSVEATTTYEDVTFPEGTIIEVEMGSDGKPKEPLMKKVLTDSKNSKQFYINATIVTGEMLGFETGMPVKMYLSGNNMAFEFSIGVALRIRMVYAGSKMHLIFPSQKYYYTVDSGEDASDLIDTDFNLWKSIGSDTMDYVSTSKVTIKGNSYICEEYKDSTNTNKYYFNSKKELKRIEMITADGEATIFKVSECSSKVDSNIFSVPKGYKPLTEDSMKTFLGGFAGSFGGMM
ncbi:MAG: hypothetical protein IKK09_08355 [Clostridia bacterium]|nr:hypothetical protein [Clostridia bacterium]